MITEDYVSIEVSKLLKEKGFNWHCFAYHLEKDKDFVNPNTVHFSPTMINYDVLLDTSIIICPTLQMAMKWLREEKDVQIEISIVGTDTWESPTKWMYGFRCQTKDIIDRRNADFSSYEEAAEAAIKYCLENLI